MHMLLASYGVLAPAGVGVGPGAGTADIDADQTEDSRAIENKALRILEASIASEHLEGWGALLPSP
jgi:hypothetical protein